ncbi:MAG: Gfo/Idh/MocA family protein [Victivallaceae bacterium]
MIKLGVIGCGHRVGGFLAQTLDSFDPDFRVVGVVDPDREGVLGRLREVDREARFFSTLDELVREAKPDALLIGTRCNLHTRYAIEAERYGIPVFLEKPVSIAMDEALALEEAYLKSKTKVLVSFPLRYTPLHRRMRELLRGGAVGDIHHITGLNYVPYGTVYFERGYRDFAVTQGLFLQKATHDFDYLMDLADSRITRISANWSRGRIFGGDRPAGLKCSACADAETCDESPRNRRRNGSGGVTDDHLCVFSAACGNDRDGINEEASNSIFEFENGAIGSYSQVVFSRREGLRGPIVSGPRGTASFDWYKGAIHYVEHHAPFTSDIRMGSEKSHFGGDVELAKNFIDIIRYGALPETPLADGLRSVYTCLAAREAAETGRRVEVRRTRL